MSTPIGSDSNDLLIWDLDKVPAGASAVPNLGSQVGVPDLVPTASFGGSVLTDRSGGSAARIGGARVGLRAGFPSGVYGAPGVGGPTAAVSFMGIITPYVIGADFGGFFTKRYWGDGTWHEPYQLGLYMNPPVGSILSWEAVVVVGGTRHSNTQNGSSTGLVLGRPNLCWWTFDKSTGNWRIGRSWVDSGGVVQSMTTIVVSLGAVDLDWGDLGSQAVWQIGDNHTATSEFAWNATVGYCRVANVARADAYFPALLQQIWDAGGTGSPGTPVVSNQSPTPGSAIVPSQAIGFDVTDSTVTLVGVVVYAIFGDPNHPRNTDRWEVVHDGVAFGPNYDGLSSRSSIANGYHFTAQRNGGWPVAPYFQVRAFDAGGGGP